MAPESIALEHDNLNDLGAALRAAAEGPRLAREKKLQEEIIAAKTRQSEITRFTEKLEKITPTNEPSFEDFQTAQDITALLTHLAEQCEESLPDDIARQIKIIHGIREKYQAVAGTPGSDIAVIRTALVGNREFITRMRGFFSVINTSGVNFCQGLLRIAQDQERVAFSHTEEGRGIAQKIGLTAEIVTLPDTIERTLLLFERSLTENLSTDYEYASIDKRREEIDGINTSTLASVLLGAQRKLQSAESSLNDAQYERNGKSYNQTDHYRGEVKRIQDEIDFINSVNTALQLRAFERNAVIPAIVQNASARLRIYAVRTYPQDIEAQRRIFDLAGKGLQFHNPNGEFEAESHARYFMFNSTLVPAGLTQEDLDAINNELLRARALKAAVFSPRTTIKSPRADFIPHPNGVLFGARAIERYLAFQGRSTVHTSRLGAVTGAISNYALHNPFYDQVSAAPSPIREEPANDSNRRDDKKFLRDEDITFIPELLALEKMERQILDAMDSDAQARVTQYTYKPYVDRLFPYHTDEGIPYVHETNRSDLIAAHEAMCRAVAENARRANAANQELPVVVPTLEDAMKIITTLRGQLIASAQQQKSLKLSGESESAKPKELAENPEIAALHDRIRGLTSRVTELSETHTEFADAQREVRELQTALGAIFHEIEIYTGSVPGHTTEESLASVPLGELGEAVARALHGIEEKVSSQLGALHRAELGEARQQIVTLRSTAQDLLKAFDSYRGAGVFDGAQRKAAEAAIAVIRSRLDTKS